MRETLSIDTDTLGEQLLVNCAKTSMSSKIVGSDSEFFAKIAVQATQTVKVTKSDGKVSYPISAINVLKAHGKSAKESQVIQGYAITTGRASQVSLHFMDPNADVYLYSTEVGVDFRKSFVAFPSQAAHSAIDVAVATMQILESVYISKFHTCHADGEKLTTSRARISVMQDNYYNFS